MLADNAGSASRASRAARLEARRLNRRKIMTFTYKDIIQMDYETCKRLIRTVNDSQTTCALQLNAEHDMLELTKPGALVERFPMKLIPWVEPGEEDQANR